jgi:hypothetical protein
MKNLVKTIDAQEKKIYALAAVFMMIEWLRHFGVLGEFARHGTSKFLFEACGTLLGLYIGLKVFAWRNRARLQNIKTGSGYRASGRWKPFNATDAQAELIYACAAATFLLVFLRNLGVFGAFGTPSASVLLFEAGGALISAILFITVRVEHNRAKLKSIKTGPSSN